MLTERPAVEEELSPLNLSNLLSLWESVGKANGTLENHRGFSKVYNPGSSWPNRLWLTGEEDAELTQAALRDASHHLQQKDRPLLLVLTENQAASAGDWLEAQGQSLLFAQTGMTLDLESGSLAPTAGELEVREVNTPDEASLWTRCASESFGYSVGAVLVQNALDIPGISFYLGTLSEAVVGTGLLCTHRGVAGFHMAGTRPMHRRRSVARQMMHHLLREGRAGGFRHGTLQASAMGEPLYSQLGFRKQFILYNYLRSAQ
jgi:ribosomal protein S18 acetylase RimI-like enzyme